MIKMDITKQLDQFSKMHSSMNFIISKSMNNVAFQKSRKEAQRHMRKELEIKNKQFVYLKTFRVKKSHKNNLEVTLFHIKEALKLQQFGGVENAKSGKMAIPIRKNFAKYAGVSMKKEIPDSLNINTVMRNAPRNRGQTVYESNGVKPFVGKKGVYIRTSNGLRLLYVFKDKATHTKKLLDFQKVIEKSFNDNFEEELNKNYLKLIRS